MRKAVKFLHTLSACGMIGALAAMRDASSVAAQRGVELTKVFNG